MKLFIILLIELIFAQIIGRKTNKQNICAIIFVMIAIATIGFFNKVTEGLWLFVILFLESILIGPLIGLITKKKDLAEVLSVILVLVLIAFSIFTR